MENPLEQFEIQELILIRLFNYEIALLNNTEIFQILGIITLLLITWIQGKQKLITKRTIIGEIYNTSLIKLVQEQVGNTKYLPLLIAIFSIIIISNLIGMIPYSFTSTSQFILTLSFSFTVLIGVTLLGFKEQGIKFFSLLIPAGTPLGLIPLLVLVELLSYLSRSVSLGVRLGANMMAGHALIKIITFFSYSTIFNDLFSNFSLFALIIAFIPIIFITALISLEVGIAFLQSYVFIALTCSYIRDTF
jgi:F-type H+-transporting ATPase subunit a